MKRMLWFVVLAVLLCSSAAMAANTVVAETKTVALNATGVTIGIFLDNDAALTNYVIPLEIRSVDGGAFITNMKRSWPGGTRLDGKLTEIAVTNWYRDDSVGTCKSGQPGGYAKIADADSGVFHAVASSPVAAFFTRGKIFGATLPAGTDGLTPQMLLTVDVNGSNGQFEVDTTCVNPANHLVFATPTKVVPTFTKGVITVGTLNLPPVALDTSIVVSEDTAKSVPHLPALDPNVGQVLTYSPITFPSHGSIGVMNGLTGQFLYTPNANYCGPDSVQFMVCDDAASPLCATAWVHISVTCINDAPVAKDSVITTPQDTPHSVPALSVTHVDTGQTLTFAVLSGPSHGSIGATFAPTTGAFTYTPTAGYSGPDSMKFNVCDNGVPVLCGNGTVRITVTSVNHKPTAVCIARTVDAGPSCQTNADINNGSSDPDGDSITVVQVPAGPYPKGITPVKLIVTDILGVADTCQVNVTVQDTTKPVIACPASFTARTTPAGCDTTIIFTLGRAATATDNCPIPLGVVYTSPGITISGNPASGVFPKGASTVTATATDDNGNSASCTFTVTVEDHVKPVVSCPGNITQPNDPGQCGAVVTYSATPSDNCTPLPTLVGTPPSGSTFPVGVTAVKVVATDASGNIDSCSFNVTIQDTTKPSITCPSNVVVDNAVNSCGAIVSFSAPLATDNCPDVLVNSVPASGTYFPVGTTLVTCTATDASGNQQTCTFTITVNDTQKPTVTCPAPITVSVPSGTTSTPVVYGVTSGDNCPGLVNVLTPPSGSSFPLGTTDVWCVSTDAHGLKDSCTFTVTVEVGNSAPVLDPIGAKNVNEGTNLNFAIAAHDVDGDAGITLSMIDNPGGASFTDNGSGSGTFDWTPSCAQGGSVYHVKFIASDGSLADTEDVAITVADIPESLEASPSSITVNYQTGAPAPAPIPVSLTDPGCSGQFTWQALASDPWLSSVLDTGTTPTSVSVHVNPAGLSVGDHQGTITFGARVAGKTNFIGTNIVTVNLHVGPAPHDSVWVTTGSGKLGDTVAVDVNFCNNHEATGISVGLKYSSYNMHVIGASFTGSRVESISVKSATLNGIDRTICLAAIPFPPEPRIAEGCGKLATLFFVYDSTGSCPFPESTMIESFLVPPGCETMLTDTIPASVIPVFVPGQVALICPPRICGDVKNVAGGPLEDATVQLWSSYPAGSLLGTVITGPDGHFCFDNLAGAGPFDLRIFHPDYCTRIMSGVGPTDTGLLDVVLELLPVVTTTPHVAWYWSENAALAGVPLMPGDVITAIDPNGVVCGKTVVGIAGRYNIYVMGDDPTTPGVDEGAVLGDQITFYLNCTCALMVPGTWAATLTGTQFDANFDCSQKAMDIPLCDPWTLFSFNVTPPNPSPAAVLSSIAGEYQIVFTSTCAYGPLSWDANRPFNDLNSMDPFHGYWLKTSAPSVGPISLSGVPVPVNTPIDLCSGWNLISYLPDAPDTFSHALNSIDGQYSHVFGFECGNGYRSWDASRPAFLNDLNCMKPMLGYWVRTTTQTTLNYPTGGYVCNEGAPILSKPVNLLTRVTPTPWVTDFWSVANTSTTGLQAGDNLTARTPDGVICGECLVGADGAFLVHVYGDDPTTPNHVEGAVNGEALQFELNGAPATVQSGSAVWSERESIRLTVVAGRTSPVPADYALLQNYPNPFNPSTTIMFRLPAASDAKLTIYNVLGQTVRVLFSGSLSEGEHSYEWNGQNDNGQTVQSGIYFYRLDTPSWSDVKKMTFLK